MLSAHWFTPLPAQHAESCWGCDRQASWVIDGSEVMLCKRCLYCILEALNTRPDISSEELAPSLHDYVRGILPGHLASCSWCTGNSFATEVVVACVLDEEWLAPFLDHQFITPASLEQIITEYWRGYHG